MKLLNPLSRAQASSIFEDKEFRAACLSTDQVGHCVYIRAGVDVEGNYRVGKANPALESKMPAVGVIIEKLDATTCRVKRFGELTGFSGLLPGKMLFLREDGTLGQAPVPTPGLGEYVFIQRMGTAYGEEDIYLDPNFHLVKRVG